MRTVPLWVGGLFFAAYFGALLGRNLTPDYSEGGIFGMIGATMIALSCARLWLPERKPCTVGQLLSVMQRQGPYSSVKVQEPETLPAADP
jgi:hypothetical protein